MTRHLFSAGMLLAVLTGSTAMGVPFAYEGFDYPNDSSVLDGKAGGFGWTGPWVSMASPLGLTQDDVSLDAPVFPFNPVGDRVFSPEGTQGIAVRPFAGIDMSQDGNVLFASFLIKKDGSSVPGTGGNNLEFDLGVDGGQQTRFGSTSGNAFFLTVGTNSTGTVVLGDTYFMVMKIISNAATPDVVQANFYGPNDTVPGNEPSSWALTHNPDLSTLINTARMWVGTGATGALDEIRLGTTWSDVSFFDPEFVQGDFNNSGQLDIGDFNILAGNLFTGTTYSQGDFDGNGAVDLRDFIGFREAYNAAGFSLGSDLSVPEPTSGALILLAIANLSITYRRRTLVFGHQY